MGAVNSAVEGLLRDFGPIPGPISRPLAGLDFGRRSSSLDPARRAAGAHRWDREAEGRADQTAVIPVSARGNPGAPAVALGDVLDQSKSDATASNLGIATPRGQADKALEDAVA